MKKLQQPLPCGEVLIQYCDKVKIDLKHLDTSTKENLVKLICGDKVNPKQVLDNLNNRERNR